MKVMVTWTVQPGAVRDAVQRFLKSQGKPADGVSLLGRWHNTDCSGGFTLYETEDPTALFESGAVWADVLVIRNALVIEDSDAGPVLAKVFGK